MSPFRNLLTKNGDTGNGIQNGLMAQDYFSDYVNHCCDLYADKGTQILTVNTGVFGTFTGQTDSGGLFQFTSGGANPTKFSIAKPVQASDIFGAVGTLQAPNGTALGAVAAILDAALNRTVLRKNSVQPSCNTGDFYSTALVLEAF